MSLNLPFGVYRSTRGPVELKFEVIDNSARDSLITNDLINRGHIIYHINDNEHYKLVTYPIIGNLVGVVWDTFGGSLTSSEIKTLYEANPDTNAFTDALKSKLEALDDNKFKGTFTSLSALQTAHPTATEGSYAYVDAGIGQDTEVYAWDNDDTDWISVGSNIAAETPASIKSKYESNPDTNAFTDQEKLNVASNTSHVSSTANPHGVTAAQLGLGTVIDDLNGKMNDTPPEVLTLVEVLNPDTSVDGHKVVIDVGTSSDGVYRIDDLPTSNLYYLELEIVPKLYDFFALITLFVTTDYVENRKITAVYSIGSGTIWDVTGNQTFNGVHEFDLIGQTNVSDGQGGFSPQMIKAEIAINCYQFQGTTITDIEIVKKVGRVI